MSRKAVFATWTALEVFALAIGWREPGEFIRSVYVAGAVLLIHRVAQKNEVTS